MMNPKLMLITENGVQEFIPKALFDELKEKVQQPDNKLQSEGDFSSKKLTKKLYTLSQVAELFETSRPTIYAWIKKELLKPLHIGGLVYFKPSDIDQLIEDRLNAN